MGVETRNGCTPGGSLRDSADFERLRHARDRHVGFPVGRYLQPPPMLFTRDGHNVFLGDLYRGRPAFLVCGGPSLLAHDLSRLHERGILTLAVNNAAAVHRPNLWCCVDDPGNFCDAIWRDPAVLKFVPLCHMEKHFTVRDARDALVPSAERVGDMPAVLGFRRNEAFQPDQWLHEDTFNWGNHSDRTDALGQKGSRSVLYVALRLLFYLGVRRVFLLGCDFRMQDGRPNYAFEQGRSRGSVRGNNATYRALNVRLAALRPHFEREGFEVLNCTPDSGLTAFPRLSFEEALTDVQSTLPARILTAGMYDRQQRERDAARQPRLAELDTHGSPPRAGEIPDFTLVIPVRPGSLTVLPETWSTWLACHSLLARVPVLVVSAAGTDPSLLPKQCADRHPSTEIVDAAEFAGAEDSPGLTLAALLRAIAQRVRTPWFLKLDPEAVATGRYQWPLPDWFTARDSESPPVLVASPWSYTKPADALARLDDWGDTVDSLRARPRLDLPFTPTADRVRHATVSAWCLWGRTDWVRDLERDLPDSLPCPELGTFLHYCAIRAGRGAHRVPMKRHGWDHSFSWSADTILDRCRATLHPDAKSHPETGHNLEARRA